MKRVFRGNGGGTGRSTESPLLMVFPCCGVILLLFLQGSHSLPGSSSLQGSYSSAQSTSRALLESDEGEEEKVIDVNDTSFVIGYVLGWISGFVFFFALPLQIIKNVS
jgi:hypothetical protein